MGREVDFIVVSLQIYNIEKTKLNPGQFSHNHSQQTRVISPIVSDLAMFCSICYWHPLSS